MKLSVKMNRICPSSYTRCTRLCFARLLTFKEREGPFALQALEKSTTRGVAFAFFGCVTRGLWSPVYAATQIQSCVPRVEKSLKHGATDTVTRRILPRNDKLWNSKSV
jgi:hypothetical protein